MMRRRPPTTAVVGALALVALLVAFALLLARLLSDKEPLVRPAAAIVLRGGVPVGVVHSRAGALAAADEYLALSSQTLEQNPVAFAALVGQAYAPVVRSRVLSEAQQIRASDTENMANYAQGGRGLALVAAHRLDSYTSRTALVTSWLEGIVWGPHLPPRQTWNVVDTTLSWSGGRWLILDSHVDANAAPVPAIAYLRDGDDTAGAFARLDGMSSPTYGADE